MNKIPCASQNLEAKTLLADVCVFDYFGWLSPAAVHTADCQFDSRVKWWIHVSSIVTYSCKNSFCCIETVANNALNRQHVVVFDRCSCKMVNTLPSDIFNSSAISTTSNYDQSKRVCGVFWCFPGQLPNLGDLSIQHHLCLYDCV